MDLYLDLDDLHYDNNGIFQPIWNFFAGEIWPIFAPNIRHLTGHHLGDLRRQISPTIFTDCNQLNSIDSDNLLPASIADDGPNATSRQALTNWLHTPTKNGHPPKQLSCCDYTSESNEWFNNFKKEFLRANSSASYIIQFKTYTTIAQFELVNERTKEKLTLKAEDDYDVYTHINFVLERCQIVATIQWRQDKKTDNLNNVDITIIVTQ